MTLYCAQHSPLQTMEDSVFTDPMPFPDDLSMYDNFIKSEPASDSFQFGSCSALMSSPLPPFGQTFFNPCSYTQGDDQSGFQHSWAEKHPDHWTPQEVLAWVYDVAQIHNLDASKIPGENFQNICGVQLCHMQRDEFVTRDPTYGMYLYDILQDLLKGAKFSEPECDSTLSSDNFPMVGASPYVEDTLTDISNSTCTEDGIKVLIGRNVYDIDLKLPIEIPDTDQNVEFSDPGYYSESSTDIDKDSDSHSEHTDIIDMEAFSHDVYAQNFMLPKYRCHSDSLSSTCSDMSEEVEPTYQRPPKKQNNRGRPAGQASKGNHLWEFIRDTLKDPNFNPTLLKWEDKEEGVFRFVQSEAVAQMWGRKKNNTGMTYEKLSRAMRFCRTTGFFDPLPKNGKYPKKLCFKFGSKAFGWQD